LSSKPHSLTRRYWLRTVAMSGTGMLMATASLRVAEAASLSKPIRVEIWKDPACGCCHDWITHLQTNGFTVDVVHDAGNASARQRLRIPAEFGSCHTALVDGYALEGHVPARDIKRLLKDRPKAIGLVVPGMPVGSPGMDGPAYGGRQGPFDVLLVAMNGSTSIYQRY